MLSRICVTAVFFGLVLGAPSLAQGPSAPSHPAALVDVNALTADSDFTVFMRDDVPEDVHRRALRKLWVLMKLPASTSRSP